MSKRLTTEEFIKRAREVHGDKYDYSKVEYKGSHDKVSLVCNQHGEFSITPNNYLNGRGCPKCRYIKSSSTKKKFHSSQRDWNFEQPEEYKLIPITKRKFVKVDNEDFDRLKDINWQYDNGYATSANVGRMHRFIMNCPEGMVVDHINHDTLDNRKSNLRIATRTQNNANRKSQQRSSSLYKGVSWRKYRNKWEVNIAKDGLSYKLGYFTDEKEAGMAYDRKALELFGEFAYLNFPELKHNLFE